MKIDPIYPKSSGMAGINRFDKFSLEEIEIIGRAFLQEKLRYKEKLDEAHTDFLKKGYENEITIIEKLIAEKWEAFGDINNKAKRTSSEYPCPTCNQPSVFCDCSSSCNHSRPYTYRYCNHCEERFPIEPY